jgi:diguanylate cyclase (GGDEF)-like protein
VEALHQATFTHLLGVAITFVQSKPLEALPQWAGAPDPLPGGKLDLLLRDFASVLGCEVSLVCELEGDHGARVAASWGIDGSVAVTVPERGGRRRGGRPQRGGCFVGRALAHGRPAFETLDPDRDQDLIDAAGVTLTHALAIPVQFLDTPTGRALVAGFSTPPRDLARTLWVADSYARLVALLAGRPEALGGLLEREHRDGLTGCLTYQSVMEELAREINRSARASLRLSCCFIDLDGFKRVNDVHGHLRGNEVLADVGVVLRDGVRSCDTVGRYGGDEFIAILPQTGGTEAALLAERLRAMIASGHAERFEARLTASIGVAEWSLGLSGEQLLARADSALFAAKGLPGGVTTHDQTSTKPANGRILAR